LTDFYNAAALLNYGDFIILSVFCNKEMEEFAPTLSPNKKKKTMDEIF
jgi:hypothetical protein